MLSSSDDGYERLYILNLRPRAWARRLKLADTPWSQAFDAALYEAGRPA